MKSRLILLGLTLSLSWTALTDTQAAAANKSTARYQHEVAETQVTVVSVLPWDDVRQALKPKFQFTATQALKEVVPNTAALEESYLNSLAAALRVSTPMSGSSRSLTETVDQAGNVFRTNTLVRSSGPGEMPEPETLAAPGTLRQPGERPEGLVSTDPMLRYLAANALNQEVQLLNAYLDGAVPEGFQPYLVRLQVTTSPYGRNRPYDLFATLSLFPEAPSAGSSVNSGPDLGLMFMAGALSSLKMQDSLTLSEVTWGNGTNGPAKVALPIVVPLLVTDNLEGTLRARSEERLRQFALGLAAMLQGVGADLQFRSLSDRLERVFGTDLNSLLTVGQIAPNVVRIRLGALNQAGNGSAMVPRNHFVTLLVLAPRSTGVQRLSGVVSTQMREAASGRLLEERYRREVGSRARGIFERHGVVGLSRSESETLANSLVAFIEAGSFDGAVQWMQSKDCLGGACPSPEVAAGLVRNLWGDIASLRLGSAYKSFRFTLPAPPEARVPEGGVVALLQDPGKGSATITLGGGSRLAAAGRLAAHLKFTPPSGAPVLLPARSLAVSPDGTTITATLPSPKQVFGDNADGLMFTLIHEGGDQRTDYPAVSLRMPQPAPESAWTISSTTSWIRSRPDGTGTLAVSLSTEGKAPLEFQVTGATVDRFEVEPSGAVALSAGGWVAEQSAIVRLHLSNLIPGGEVSIGGAEVPGVTPAGASWKVYPSEPAPR